jgi:arsenite methyltransferase
MNISGRKGHYGVDAPYVPAFMLAGSVVCVGLIVFAHMMQLWVTIVILMALVCVYLHTTLRGKFLVWRAQLTGINWRGDERVLDLGCGRGAVLLMAAEYVPRGQVIGVDIWSTKDQSGNAMAMAHENALNEGVADRVELHTADMRQLPFESGSFDVIVSSVAIHNIGDRVGRDQAISKSSQYRQRLVELGATVARRNLGWRMWWGGPWVPTQLIDATKSAVQ